MQVKKTNLGKKYKKSRIASESNIELIKKRLEEFAASEVGEYSLRYTRAVVQCRKDGHSLIPQILLGDNYGGLRDKRQKLDLATEATFIKLTPEEKFLYKELGGAYWFRPLLNAILGDLAEYSRFLSSGGDKASKQGLKLAARMPAALVNETTARKLEEVVADRVDVQRLYPVKTSKRIKWADMPEFRQIAIVTNPRRRGHTFDSTGKPIKSEDWLMDAIIRDSQLFASRNPKWLDEDIAKRKAKKDEVTAKVLEERRLAYEALKD
jgi:hypothetical protein